MPGTRSRVEDGQFAFLLVRSFRFIRGAEWATVGKEYDETGAVSSRHSTPAAAATFQRFDSRQTLQSAHFFSRDGLESLADAAHGRASAAQFSQAQQRPGGSDLDRARFIPGAVHRFERAH